MPKLEDIVSLSLQDLIRIIFVYDESGIVSR